MWTKEAMDGIDMTRSPITGKKRNPKKIYKCKITPRIKALNQSLLATEQSAKNANKDAEKKKEQASQLYKDALKTAIELGGLLNDMKEKRRGKGDWIAFVKKILEMKERTAQRYMKVARNVLLVKDAISIRDATRIINIDEDRIRKEKKEYEAKLEALREAEEAKKAKDLADEIERKAEEARKKAGKPEPKPDPYDPADDPDPYPDEEDEDPKVEFTVMDDSFTPKDVVLALFRTPEFTTDNFKEFLEMIAEIGEITK